MKYVIIVLVSVLLCIFLHHLFFSAVQPPAYELRGTNIICFGNSLTYGIGASAAMDYPNQLARLIGQPVINAGIPGDTIHQGLARLERDVLHKSPRIVIVALGANDLRNQVPAGEAFEKLKMIVETIQAKGALVIIAGIDIPLWGRGFKARYRKVARETGALLIPNILEGIWGQPDLLSDQVHPNDKGYQRIAAMVYEKIKPYVNE